MSTPTPSASDTAPVDTSSSQTGLLRSDGEIQSPAPFQSHPASAVLASMASLGAETSKDASCASQGTEVRGTVVPGVSGGSSSTGAADEVSGALDGDEEAELEVGKKGRGKPSHFTGPRLLAMQQGLRRYMELRTKKEKTQFWPSFMSELMEQFPLSQYPIPASRLVGREDFVEKSPQEIEAMPRKSRNAYQRVAKLALATDEELYLQMVKDWFFWQQNTARKVDGGMTGALLKAELEKKKKQVKPQFNHFIMKHPDYKARVLGLSSETGRDDRLPKRAQAVKDLLDDLPPEEVERLKGEYNESTYNRHRKNFGSVAQDVLNIWRRLTGLNLVLLAGECMDGEADYDSYRIFSKPDGCPDMDAGEGVDFDRFSNTFLHWLKEIYTRTHPQNPNEPANSSSIAIATVTPSATSESTPCPEKAVMPDPSGSKSRETATSTSKNGRKGLKRPASSVSDDDTPEPSEPSDMGSDSEGEGEGSVSQQARKVLPPVNSEGLWEKNEEGLPVLKIPMCDLTREQQAAFTREYAVAIGLTKAVEELQEDMSSCVRGKKGGVSKYKGRKATRKSSRIQKEVTDKEQLDGFVAADQLLRMDDGQETRGHEPDVEVNDGAIVSTEWVNNDNTDTSERVLRSVDNVEALPSWGKAVVLGYSELDIPRMESWAHFDVEGCSTPFLKDYGGWLLGPSGVQRPEAWSALVYRWIEVEEEWNERKVGTVGPQFKMLKNKRPQGFLQWFKYGRLRWEALVPSDVSPETLGQEWWVWWSKVVNPRWRPKAEEMVMPGGQGSWEAVRIPGKDGFILVLVALRWWCDILDDPEQDLLWISTLKAVFWTLEELLKDARTNLQAVDGSDSDESEHQAEPVDGGQSSGDKRKRNGNAGRERKRRR